MKEMKSFYLFSTIIILIFIAISLSTSVGYSPYTMNNMYKNYHPYEGFSSSIGFAKNAESAAPAAALNMPEFNNKKKTACKKVFGFDGLYCDPTAADEQLDYFSNAKGGFDCQGSGLSNSNGSLCFDKTMTGLLTTRGGNAKGGDAQIGF